MRILGTLHGHQARIKGSMMSNSFFRNAFDRFVAARERQAARYVNGALMSMDSRTLKAMGTSREELRRKGACSSVF
jgi:hypothetical protein